MTAVGAHWCADGLQDASIASRLLEQNEALKSLLQQDPADAAPEVGLVQHSGAAATCVLVLALYGRI
jgi:hypothetical protein